MQLEAMLPMLNTYVPHLREVVDVCRRDAPIEPSEPNRFQTKEIPQQTSDFLKCKTPEDTATRTRLSQEVFKQVEQAKDPELKKALKALCDWLESDFTGRAGVYTKFFNFLTQLEAASNHWASAGVAVILPPAFDDNLLAAEPTGEITPHTVSGGFESMRILRTWQTEIKMNKHLLEANCANLVGEVTEALGRWNVSRREVIQLCADAVANLQRVETECAAKYNKQVEGYTHLKGHYLGRTDRRAHMVSEMERYIVEVEAIVQKFSDLARAHKQVGEEITRDSVKHIGDSEKERVACEEELQAARNNNLYFAKIREGMDRGLAVLTEAVEANKRTFATPLEKVDDALTKVEERHDECYQSVETALIKQQTDLPKNIERAKERATSAQAVVVNFENEYEEHTSAHTDEEYHAHLQIHKSNADFQTRMLHGVEEKLRQAREHYTHLQRDFAPFGKKEESAPASRGLFGGPTGFPHTLNPHGQKPVPPHAQRANSQEFQPMGWGGMAPTQATPWAGGTAPLPPLGFGPGHPGWQNNQ